MATARITRRDVTQTYGRYFGEIKTWHIEGGSISPRNQAETTDSVTLKQLEFAVKIYLTFN